MAVYEVLEVKLKFQDKFMIYLTILNAPLVKKKIKYVFLENHISPDSTKKWHNFCGMCVLCVLILSILLIFIVHSVYGKDKNVKYIKMASE